MVGPDPLQTAAAFSVRGFLGALLLMQAPDGPPLTAVETEKLVASSQSQSPDSHNNISLLFSF